MMELIPTSKTEGLTDSIPVGTVISHIDGKAKLRLTSDDPNIAPHLDSDWLKGFVNERLEIESDDSTPGKSEAPLVGRGCTVSFTSLGNHAVVFGAAGSGKTRLALHLLSEHLKRGGSLVAMDPKPDTITHLLTCAQAAGIQAHQITLFAPQESEQGVPGWNPFDYSYAQIPIAEIAGGFMSIMEQNATWLPRMESVLSNAVTVIASQRLTFYELVRFLQSAEYRLALLRRVEATGYESYTPDDELTVREAVEYFTDEFAALSKAEQASAIPPVVNRIREFLRVPFLRAMLCTRQSQLDFSCLWQKQEVVIVHLDRTALGDKGLRLLGGLLVWQLYRTAMQVKGTVPVLLSLDELGIGEQFIGKAAAEILAIARSRNLRLLVACQHLEQLSNELRASLLTNTAFRAYFRLGVPDARLIASALSAGTGEKIARIDLEQGKGDYFVEIPHPIVDGDGKPLQLTEDAWSAFIDYLSQSYYLQEAIGALSTLATLSGIQRMYVLPPGGAHPVEIGKYVQGIRPCSSFVWSNSPSMFMGIGYVVRGPVPLTLGIRFPRFKLTVTSKQTESERQQQWVRRLGALPNQHAVIWTENDSSAIVKIVSVPDANRNSDSLARFTSAVLRRFANQREVREVETYRREEAQRVREGEFPGAPEPEVVAAPARVKSRVRKRDGSKQPEPPTEKTEEVAVTHASKQAKEPVEVQLADDGSIV